MSDWKPNDRQAEFLSLPDTIFEALYGGAAGGGKTESLLVLPIVKKSPEGRFLYEYPRFKVLYLRRTFPELENEVIPRSKQFYEPCGFEYNGTQKRWTNKISGSIIQFGHCEHEKDVSKYDSAEYNIILFDELTTFTPYQYQYLTFSRCRSSNPLLPAFVRSGTNPGGIGHGYVRKRFVEPCREGGAILQETVIIDDIPTIKKRIFIPSRVQDNPHLSKDYVSALHSLPTAEKAAKLNGDWWVFSGQVFDNFRTTPLPGEPKQAQHVVEPFPIPYYWPRILSIDWGFSALTVASWYAINPVPTSTYPAKVYKYREYAKRKAPISTWAADIARLSQGETFTDIVLDPSAWQNRGQEQLIVEEFIKHSGLNPRKANNDRLGGKLLVQEFLRWESKPAKIIPKENFDIDVYLKIHRFKGPKAAEDYRLEFQPEEVDEYLPKFKIFSTCPGIIDNITKCIYVVDTARKSEDNPGGHAEDVAELKNDVDDYYDELRYGLQACKNYLDLGIREHNKETQIAKIYENYQKSGSLTQLNMQLDEVDRTPEVVRTRRFSGSRLKLANF